MAVPRAAIDLVERWESLKLVPYLCPAGVPTIGWGTTRYENGRTVTLKDSPIARDVADVLLFAELERCCAAVDRLCPGQPESRRAALADFCYNLGAGRLRASTLRECVNEGEIADAADEFGKWVYAGGRKLSGLVARRAQEAALFRG